MMSLMRSQAFELMGVTDDLADDATDGVAGVRADGRLVRVLLAGRAAALPLHVHLQVLALSHDHHDEFLQA